jgi:RNA polymerase-binding transcription factor DksA
MLTPEFIEEMKAKLLEAKQRLTGDLEGLSSHTEVGEDYDENATEIQIDEANQDMRTRFAADLEKIEKALAKIEAGTYGVDDDGQEIGEDRLRAMPWADKAI